MHVWGDAHGHGARIAMISVQKKRSNHYFRFKVVMVPLGLQRGKIAMERKGCRFVYLIGNGESQERV